MTIEQSLEKSVEKSVESSIGTSSGGTAKDSILTHEQADFVLRKIADHRAAAARIRENAELMAKAEDNEAANLEWRFGPALQAFVRHELAGSAKKSIRLFHGVLGFRTKQEFFIRHN